MTIFKKIKISRGCDEQGKFWTIFPSRGKLTLRKLDMLDLIDWAVSETETEQKMESFSKTNEYTCDACGKDLLHGIYTHHTNTRLKLCESCFESIDAKENKEKEEDLSKITIYEKLQHLYLIRARLQKLECGSVKYRKSVENSLKYNELLISKYKERLNKND